MPNYWVASRAQQSTPGQLHGVVGPQSMPVEQRSRFFDHQIGQRLHQVDTREVPFHPGNQLVGRIARHVARPLPLPDRCPEFYPRQSENSERVPAGRIRQPEHSLRAGFLNVELYQRAGIQIVDGQGLSSLA